MMVQFYMRGDFAPIIYDYDMDINGELVPSKTPFKRTVNVKLIVLDSPGSGGPSKAQRGRIAALRKANPTCMMDVRFARNRTASIFIRALDTRFSAMLQAASFHISGSKTQRQFCKRLFVH